MGWVLSIAEAAEKGNLNPALAACQLRAAPAV
jgi:hypothetical protein